MALEYQHFRYRRGFRWFLSSKECTNSGNPAKYVFGLDGLRAIAVMLVFLGHYGIIGPGPAFGVQMFFVVSGFIIARMLLAEYQEAGTINVPRFYLRRFLRLSPVLMASIAVIVMGWTLVGRAFEPMAVVSSVFYFSNYWQIYSGSDIYLMPLWSLAIEEHFYLIFPTMLLVCLRFGTHLRPFLVACLIVLSWRIYLWETGTEAWDIYLRTDTRIDALLFGVVLAMIASAEPLNGLGLGWASLAGVAVMVGSFLFRDATFRSTLMYTLQAAGFAGVAAYLLFSKHQLAHLLRKGLEGDAPKFVGKMSYSIYLWHLPTLKILEQAAGKSAIITLAATLATLALSFLSYRFIEKPMLSIRHRFGSHAR
jgi:peptidoglycan/LPS O-acetylase OafA/YrhL